MITVSPFGLFLSKLLRIRSLIDFLLANVAKNLAKFKFGGRSSLLSSTNSPEVNMKLDIAFLSSRRFKFVN